MTTSKKLSETNKRPRKKSSSTIDHDYIALVLQGGGALGAYQAGVYEAMCESMEPGWVAGVSIGSVNAAIIAGNEPHRRLERLKEFWNLVTSGSALLAPVFMEQWSAIHQIGASMAASVGVPGFYRPWPLPPIFQPEGTDPAISYYDTTPLRDTLVRLVDFDLINTGKVRLSIGAVNVRTGNYQYFDSTNQVIGPEHIMASGALPPAFAPVLIDGEYYWDGGVVSNTPLQYVLDSNDLKKTMVVQVDLFSARGVLPLNMNSVMTRQKDIQYSSRTRLTTDRMAEKQRTKQAVHRVISKLPLALKNDPDVKHLIEATRTAQIDIAHLIYRQDKYELESKDFDFSRAAMQKHWEAGKRDMTRTLAHPDWLQLSPGSNGVAVYDLAHAEIEI